MRLLEEVVRVSQNRDLGNILTSSFQRKCELSSTNFKEKKFLSKGQGLIGDSEAPDQG